MFINSLRIEPKETMYGSLNRLLWLKSFLTKDQIIVDIGCGTGSMITIPLICEGYNVVGIDLDEKSISYGKDLLRNLKEDDSRLRCINFEQLDILPDIIIISEVLEHLPDTELHNLLSLTFRKLKKGGHLLITIPNGYGFFELESFLWHKLKFGTLLEKLYIVEATIILKNKLLGYNTIEPHPSSLDSSPHVQRFTYGSIEKKLKKEGFFLEQKQGGTLLSGPFSNLFFTGIKPIMKANIFLGKKLSRIASDFYINVQKK